MVIGAGPAGTQAAVSAAHQLRHVALIDAGTVGRRRGRAFWSKSVQMLDVPVFPGVTGPELLRSLKKWADAQPERQIGSGNTRRTVGIRRIGGYARQLLRGDDGVFTVDVRDAEPPNHHVSSPQILHSRAVVVATGFEDRWPDIEVDASAERMYTRYQTVFRFAGNHRGWHVCIRCDGHLHADGSLAIVGVGDYIFDVVNGAQDFTDQITVLTNGRAHDMSPAVIRDLERRGVTVETTRIAAHIGKGKDLLGLRLVDGRELFFDGFFVDEGLDANDEFLSEFPIQHNAEGLIVCDEDHRIMDANNDFIPGLWACGDIVAGRRKLIASAFASGQDAGLAASDSLRRWKRD